MRFMGFSWQDFSDLPDFYRCVLEIVIIDEARKAERER